MATAVREIVGPPPIAVSGLTHVFPGGRDPVTALADVSLAVRAGEFCALIGPSGCGKTTLLHILAGLITPTAGTVTVPARANGRLPTALVFQGVSTLPWFTVRENVEYGLRLLGVPAEVRRARAARHLEQVGLAGFADAYPHQLSEGMRQRVSIARALAVDPDVLLMDEPFANLDEQNRLLLQEELLRLWQASGKTVLFVTHSLDEALRLADRVLVMTARPGRIKSEVAVPLARPRHFREIRRDPEYGALSARLWDELRDEVLKAAGR
ncbi:MAG: ABC transporter ATP-binding protein [Armatimonadota bacterium]|nr:ABC transporter ATP-binding protein [Armatimonadota bacterium]MDR7450697.1 ABC transporter ATP-binding protein [Armatimonadota bacterium]MDR7466053.1 ABC transporter ATP-binding protein [Armatimonadota bacterium]MDR7493910.1 ABC transporter ATP-binding protein [Armatimonadota bacterium]MDR7504015.1 ABC transporter ATP-binding protein [Armatimonadota bacterium]